MTEEIRRQFEQDGVATIPGVFTEEEVNRMRGAALVALHTDNPTYKHRYLETKDGNFPALLFWPTFVSPYLNQIRKDKRLSDIVEFFLGPNVKQLNNQVYYRLPGDNDEFAWHQDIVFRKPPERYPGIETAYLQTTIAIDDITLDNSPVEYIPGSHLHGVQELGSKTGLTNMWRVFNRNGLQGKKYLARRGDVMVWSVLTVHGSEKNESSFMRMTYMNGFAKAEAALDWPWYLKDGKMQDADVRLIP